MSEMEDKGIIGPVSRRGLLKGALVGGATLVGGGLLSACGSTTSVAASGGGLDYPAHPKWHFVFVNHVTTNPFFVPTQYGIQDACKLVGCTYSWTGSETSQVSEMVNAIETAIASHADGIATSIIAPEAFNGPVQQAIAAGIPVVAYNATVSPNPAMSYIGQDLYVAGQQMGQKILSLVPPGSHIGLFIATPGSANIQPRIDGAIAAIRAAGNPITYDVVATGALVSQELSAVQSWYLGHKSAKGMFAVDAGSTQSVGQVMQQFNLPAQGWHAGGFDLLPLTLKLIDTGYLDFTIDQQPYEQGFYPVMQLYLYKLSGGLMSPDDTETGLKFITKKNVGLYLKTQSRFEGSTAKELDLANI
ncbi:MAG: sugar ABC transporter substrate-binding protein [Sulfobacillus sp.]|nr:sugar ABC transporter substrate-binding protein [Sulfobacillus sp.]